MNSNQTTKYATVGENTEITIKLLSGDQCNTDLRVFLLGPRSYILTKAEVEYPKRTIQVTHIHSQLRVDISIICFSHVLHPPL